MSIYRLDSSNHFHCVNGYNFILRIMKSKQVLSIEQMKHFQELGLDTSDASMCWCRAISHKSATWELEIYEYVINQKLDSNFWETTPTYTLQDILYKLPQYIHPFASKRMKFTWVLEKDTIAYRNVENIYDCFKYFTDYSLINAAYEMLCWCIEKGYIKTN